MKPTNHTQHLVHEVSYICKCMRTQDSDFTGSLCRQNDELCNLQGEIYLMSLPDPKGPWASCSSLLWETNAGKSWQCFIGELRQGRIPALHGTDLSTLSLSPLHIWHIPWQKRDILWSSRMGRDAWSLGHIRGVRTNLPRKGAGSPLKWHHIKHSHSPGFSTQERHQEALCHPGGNAGHMAGAAALRDAAGGGTRHHATHQCGTGDSLWHPQCHHGDRHNWGTAARGGSQTKASRAEARASPNPITAYAGRNFPNPWSHSGL